MIYRKNRETMPKVKIQQFLFGKNHSWAFVGQSIAKTLINRGWEVDMISTDGVKSEFLPFEFFPYNKNHPNPPYDLQISYTAPHNFPHYLKKEWSTGSGKRYGIWAYEWPYLPKGFAKFNNFVDRILAPSRFCFDSFILSGVPENKVEIVPHGIDLEKFKSPEIYPLKTAKIRKILLNIGQNHARKNILGSLCGFGRAFTKKDDVCLVAKISNKKIEHGFEVDVKKILEEFNRKFPNHAEVELITGFVPDVVSLYNACDIVYSLSHCEGFYLPALEALAVGKLNVTCRYGGQLDFLNDENAVLVEGNIQRSPASSQYWTPDFRNSHFMPDEIDAATKLKYVVENYPDLHKKMLPKMKETAENLTWDKVVSKILAIQ